MLGVGMHLRKGKVTKSEAESAAQPLLHLFYDRVGLAAVRALVIPIFDECRGSVRRSLHVIAIADRENQTRNAGLTAGHGLSDQAGRAAAGGSDSSASRMPSAPGFTPIGER